MAYENDYGNKDMGSELYFQLECNTASVKDPCNSTPLLIEILMFCFKGNDLFHHYIFFLFLLSRILPYIVLNKLHWRFHCWLILTHFLYFFPLLVARIKWIQFSFPLKYVMSGFPLKWVLMFLSCKTRYFKCYASYRSSSSLSEVC